MEGDPRINGYTTSKNISIHSLRMEGDLLIETIFILGQHFNPLPPHGGRPHFRHLSGLSTYNFNPLPPHGGRLIAFAFALCLCTFQSTPSAWRETRILETLVYRKYISIHSLRMEGDPEDQPTPCKRESFQSTPSAWRETHTKNQTVKNEIFQSTPSAWRETKISCQ